MKRVSMLPSLLTCGNFACGVISICLCLQSTRLDSIVKFHPAATMSPELQSMAARADELLFFACVLLFLAMIFDMLDGRVARMTGAVSDFGGELDSLADDCSFGIAPAVIVYTLWTQSQPDGKQWYGQVLLCCVIYAVFTILRLARYNVSSGVADKNYFTGLPSPGAAGAAVSAVLFCRDGYLDWLWRAVVENVPTVWGWFGQIPQPGLTEDAVEARALAVYLLFLGWLMFTHLRFTHMANKYLGGRRRITTVVGMVALLGLTIFAWNIAVFAAFNGYVAFSIIGSLRQRLTKGKPVISSSPEGRDDG